MMHTGGEKSFSARDRARDLRGMARVACFTMNANSSHPTTHPNQSNSSPSMKMIRSKSACTKGGKRTNTSAQGTNMATLGGFLPAIVTPLNADKTVDVASLRRLAKHMFESGVDGLYIGGESDPTTHHSVSAHHSCSVFCCPCQWQAVAQPEHCSGTAHAVIERNPLACVFKPT